MRRSGGACSPGIREGAVKSRLRRTRTAQNNDMNDWLRQLVAVVVDLHAWWGHVRHN